MLGMQPASAAKMNSVQVGACKRVHSSNISSAPPPINADSGSTLPWPKRSTSRETCGAQNAVARANVAATAPASAYPPLSCESMVITPMPVMEIGMRAIIPARTKARAPGAVNNSR